MRARGGARWRLAGWKLFKWSHARPWRRDIDQWRKGAALVESSALTRARYASSLPTNSATPSHPRQCGRDLSLLFLLDGATGFISAPAGGTLIASVILSPPASHPRPCRRDDGELWFVAVDVESPAPMGLRHHLPGGIEPASRFIRARRGATLDLPPRQRFWPIHPRPWGSDRSRSARAGATCKPISVSWIKTIHPRLWGCDEDLRHVETYVIDSSAPVRARRSGAVGSM
jgi:hypothetical protein